MKTRRIGDAQVSAIGLGCMNVCHAYGTALPREEAGRLFQAALDMGYTHFDTAAVYGLGVSESLIGEYLSHRRDEFHLASKFGIGRDAEGNRAIVNSPDYIRKTCDECLTRLNTDVIDLFYLHRWDMKTPIEEVVGVMAELVEAGKVKALGLSEVSATTVRKAHAVHPIAAVQSEYSLWTRNPEIGVLDACREIGATMVAFSPVARQFLTGKLRDVSGLAEGDLRKTMPRFLPEIYAENLKLLDEYEVIANEVGCTMAQLAMAWLLKKDECVLPIPGTAKLDHLEENLGAADVELSDDAFARLDALINQNTVKGGRYTDAMQATVDTEEF